MLLDLERRGDEDLATLRTHYSDLARQPRANVKNGPQDTGIDAVLRE